MSRRRYQERMPRPGWDINYTTVGGAWARPADRATDAGVQRYAAQAMVAVTSSRAPTPGADVLRWVTIVQRIVQRSRNAPISPAADVTLRLAADPADTKPLNNESLTQALAATSADSWELDPAIELDPTWEQPFWDRCAPAVRRWMTPQASLEGLTGSETPTSRWVDFLVYAPDTSPTVIELDGMQHRQQVSVDNERDGLLRRSQIVVERLPGIESTTPIGVLATLHHRTKHGRAQVDSSMAALRHALAPSATNRFAFALAELVAHGHLVPGSSWSIELADNLGLVDKVVGHNLDWLRTIADLWGADVVPDVVSVNSDRWQFSNELGRYEKRDEQLLQPAVRIELDAFTPPHAALPTAASPTIVMRHAFLPVPLAWVPVHPTPRETITVGPHTERALEQMLKHLFNLEGFREGQLGAVIGALAGEDRFVMLPTGSGKSLIYQLVGLLQPGPVIVIDPIVALIDDQYRRLHEQGIERAVGIHRASLEENPAQLDDVGNGTAIFAFVTPERIQVVKFRDQLTQISGHQPVGLVVIDEAHCVSEWGHDFRTSYLRLGRSLRKFCADRSGTPPILLALTATASPAVLRDVLDELDLPPESVVKPSNHGRPNLRYHVVPTTDSQIHSSLTMALSALIPGDLEIGATDPFGLAGSATNSGIIFTPHVNGAFGVLKQEALIEALGIRASIYSGKQPKEDASPDWALAKRKAATDFVRNDIAVLVATKAFGMGIDKPNIRFTVHYGMPASIESFAQESGRAGRDGEISTCVLLACPPPPSWPPRLLDLRLGQRALRASYDAGPRSNDLMRQLFFLYSSYDDVELQVKSACELFDALQRQAGPLGKTEVPKRDDLERNLHRLSVLGVVDDYTVDYGGNKATVYCADYTLASVRAAHAALEQRLRLPHSDPEPTDNPFHAIIASSVRSVFTEIVDARLRALDQMARLASTELSSSQVSARIAAYLGDGPLAEIMANAIAVPTLDLAAFTLELDSVNLDADLWVGAGARQLEVTPNHPVPMIVAAFGEAIGTGGDPERFHALLTQAFSALPSYVGDEEAVLPVLRWLRRNLASEHNRAWRALLWAALPAALLSGVIADAEIKSMQSDDSDFAERAVLLNRRLQRIMTEIA